MDLTDRRVWIALIGVVVSVLAFAECRASGLPGFLCFVTVSG